MNKKTLFKKGEMHAAHGMKLLAAHNQLKTQTTHQSSISMLSEVLYAMDCMTEIIYELEGIRTARIGELHKGFGYPNSLYNKIAFLYLKKPYIISAVASIYDSNPERLAQHEMEWLIMNIPETSKEMDTMKDSDICKLAEELLCVETSMESFIIARLTGVIE